MASVFARPVPVWLWTSVMRHVGPRELRRFNAQPIAEVDYHLDIDYAGTGVAEQRLDVIAPPAADGPMPVYVYFHGGGWTSGDKAPLTKYCASQAVAGTVVINANYRRATRHHMRHILEDATAVLRWAHGNAHRFGGDPDRIVLGGDSAGGQIAALLTALTLRPELAEHFRIPQPAPPTALRGLVQHCSMADFRLVFGSGFVMGRDFVRMLLPERGRGLHLEAAARFLSPVEWVGPDFPPTFISSSARDFLHAASANLADQLDRHGVPVDWVFFGREARNARHTWQQDASYPESQEVYRRLHAFVGRVAGPLADARQEPAGQAAA